MLERAEQLSESERKTDQREALQLLARHLVEHPGDVEARLLRARIRSWLDEIEASAADYRKVLVAKPDADIELEFATALSWSDDKALLAEAVQRFGHYLDDHGSDAKTRLARAHVLLTLDRLDEALADYEALPSDNSDPAFELELATALSESSRTRDQKRSLALFDRYLAGRPDDATARLARARALLWTDDLDGAERTLRDLVATSDGTTREQARLELARVFEQSERDLLALGVADHVSHAAPDLAEAKDVRRELSRKLAPSVKASGEVFSASDGTNVLASAVDADGLLGARAQLLAHAGTFYVSRAGLDRYAHRGDAGVRFAFGPVVAEATAGVRDVADQLDWAARAAAIVRVRPWLKLEVETGRDYIYEWALRAASVMYRVNGEYARARAEARLGKKVTAEAQLVGRVLVPANSGVEASAGLMVQLSRALRIGFRGEAQTWQNESLYYWSPLAYTSSTAVLAIDRELANKHLELSAEVGGGVAWEQLVQGTFFGPTFDAAIELAYRLAGRVDVHASAGYLYTLPRYVDMMSTDTAYSEAKAMLALRIVL